MMRFFYPYNTTSIHERILKSIIFYTSLAAISIGELTHGFFFNFMYKSWPKMARIFSYHLNLPVLFKISKVIGSCAISEDLIIRVYFAFLYLRQRDKLHNLLHLERSLNSQLRKKFLKWTEFLCFNFSCFCNFYCATYYTYGWDASDTCSPIILTVLSVNSIRYLASDLYLLYSYVIFIACQAIDRSSRLIIIADKIVADEGLTESNLNQFKVNFFLLLKLIKDSNTLVSSLSILGKILVVPLMSLSFASYLEKTDSFFLFIFKWTLIVGIFVYALRVYVLNAYLSILHSKSKLLFSKLNSIIVRCELVQLAEKRFLLSVIEDISSHRNNSIVYKDNYHGIIEQWDVLSSFASTLEILLLLAGFTFKQY